jgi:hypothetical protein
MALPGTGPSLPEALASVRSIAVRGRTQANGALTTLQGGNVDTNFTFNMLDQFRTFVIQMNLWKNVSGLNAYATANLPNYGGTLTADIDTSIAAATACVAWVTSNFPSQTVGGTTYILAETLNNDGSRTQRQFTSVQTAGLQTLLQAFIGTIA